MTLNATVETCTECGRVMLEVSKDIINVIPGGLMSTSKLLYRVTRTCPLRANGLGFLYRKHDSVTREETI